MPAASVRMLFAENSSLPVGASTCTDTVTPGTALPVESLTWPWIVTVEFGWYWGWSVVTVIVSVVPNETFVVVLALAVMLAGAKICKPTWLVNSFPLIIATAVTA